jgi:hypothetical protein
MTTFQDHDWTHRIRSVEQAELTVIGQVGNPGAMGTVFKVDGRPPCLFKKYVTPAMHTARLDRLVAWRNELSPQERDFLDAYCAWPLVTVTNEGRTVGFLMRSAPAAFWVDMLGEEHTLELQHLIHAAASEKLGIPLPSPEQRLALVGQLAEILAFFDDRNIVYGDVSEKNVLWTIQRFPRIFLIDCDNARPIDLARSDAGVAMARNPSWRDPDLPEDGLPDTNSDRYALAVFCYRVFYGYYPVPRGVTASLEDDRTRVLLPHSAPHLPRLERNLVSGLGAPAFRPSAADWISVIAATDLSASGGTVESHSDELTTTRPLARVRRPRRRRGLLLPAAGSVFIAVLAAVLILLTHVFTTPESLAGYLTSWQAGPVKISVPHYEVIEEAADNAPGNRGVVLARISIRNLTTHTLDLSEAYSSLVLVVDGTFADGSEIPISPMSISGVPANLHLYYVGFAAGSWQVLDKEKKYHYANWAGVSLSADETYTSSSVAVNSAIYVTPPPGGPKVSSPVNIGPAKLHVLGIAWVNASGKILGLCPVSSWKGGNSAQNFLSN